MVDFLWLGFIAFGCFIGSVVGLTRCVESPNPLKGTAEIIAKPIAALGLYTVMLTVLLENVTLTPNCLRAAVTGAGFAVLFSLAFGTALAVRRSTTC